jgi:hypothetical protein
VRLHRTPIFLWRGKAVVRKVWLCECIGHCSEAEALYHFCTKFQGWIARLFCSVCIWEMSIFTSTFRSCVHYERFKLWAARLFIGFVFGHCHANGQQHTFIQLTFVCISRFCLTDLIIRPFIVWFCACLCSFILKMSIWNLGYKKYGSAIVR